MRRGWAVLAALALPVACSSGDNGPPPPSQSPDDFLQTIHDAQSCVLACDPGCPESTNPWKCPALDDWSKLPHAADACGGFDGKTFPAPAPGKCVATDPADQALAKATHAPPVVLPDGRRLQPAGTEWSFEEADFPGNFPDNAILVPGTKWLLVIDTGYQVQSVRAIDTSILRAGSGTPLVSSVKYDPPASLNWGAAYVAATKTLYVASGIPDPKVRAFSFDDATGTLAEDAGKTFALDASAFPQALAVTADGKTMLVGDVKSHAITLISLDAASYGKVTGSIDLGTNDVYALAMDPNDPSGHTAYASMWKSLADNNDGTRMQVVQLDVAAGTARKIVVGKEPESVAFLDARWMVVANGFSDSLSIVDRVAAMSVADVQLLSGTHGLEPTALAWDAPRKRLYATLSSANGVAAFDVDTSTTPPTITPAGTMPTSWWPTSVTADPADGTIYVTNGKGRGSVLEPREGGHIDNALLMHGTIQAIPFMDAGALAAATATWKQTIEVGKLPGYSTVQCNGAPYDFPIPQTNDAGPSTKIKHLVFVVRENKNFDQLFADLPGVEGDTAFLGSPNHMDDIWPNTRGIARTFAHMDNFYEDAEQSLQGHYWTVFGRSSDVEERRWLVTWGRGEFAITDAPGVFVDSSPLEGSIFSWLTQNGVDVADEGELLDGFKFNAKFDRMWSGGTNETTYPDSPPTCYLAARARSTCDLPTFTYVWIANDHTFGLAAGKPNPALMISENDEATGMLLDGLSHSPMWQDTLMVVVEDDPSDGKDHVDQHRTIALFAGPWVKRGYVSHAHYDMASIHKLFAHVLGKPYLNEVVANAPLPLDVFTSTPDFTPYSYVPRKWTDLSCNPKGTAGAMKAARWDFSEPDDQPGLTEQTMEYLQSLP